MTQEEKDLLFKDLSARLPYGVKVQCEDYLFTFDKEHIGIGLLYTDFNRNPLKSPKIILSGCYYGEDIKPYLFPLSSMTEEQREEYESLCVKETFERTYLYGGTFTDDHYYDTVESIDYLYKNHIDVRGLIPKGLARDATNLNIY